MAIYQGTTSTKYLNIKDYTTKLPIDVSGWELRAQLKRAPQTDTYYHELTTANGGFVIVDAVNGRIALYLDDEVTSLLPVGRIHFDVLRTDTVDGPQWMFGGSFMVKQPTTR